MYNVLDISKYIIQQESKVSRGVNNLRLQKLLYYTQCEFIVLTGEPCFDSSIEAWDFGPVIPEAYREYKIFAGEAIPCCGIFENPLVKLDSKDDEEIILNTLNACARYSTPELVEISRRQSPWRRARKFLDHIITVQFIKDFFEEVTNE